MAKVTIQDVETLGILAALGVLGYVLYVGWDSLGRGARVAGDFIARDGMPIDPAGNLTGPAGRPAPDQPGAATGRAILDFFGISYPPGATPPQPESADSP